MRRVIACNQVPYHWLIACTCTQVLYALTRVVYAVKCQREYAKVNWPKVQALTTHRAGNAGGICILGAGVCTLRLSALEVARTMRHI